MIPSSIKVPLPFEYVFPNGALCLGVDRTVDFDRRGKDVDDQARDPETGHRIWTVTVMDLDPEAGKFGRSKEVKVKIAAPVQPVPPASQMPPYPPAIEFVALMATPYTDTSGCKGNHAAGAAHKCRARQAWSLRAAEMVPASAGGKAPGLAA